jgi:MFS family permease
MGDTTSTRQAWQATFLLALFMLINFVDKIVLGLVAVPLMDELKLTPVQFGQIGSSFFWLFAVSGVAGGFLANRFRVKLLILGMVLVWSLCQLPIVYSASISTIVLCRAALGAGEGPAWPVAVHAVCKWFPDARRNLPIAVLGQGSSIGLILAGLLVPVVTATWGWRANFAVLAVIGGAWALAWLAMVDEAQLGREVGGHAVAAAEPRLSYWRLLLDRSVLGCIVTNFVGYWSLALGLTWLPAYFQRGLGFDGIASGWLYSFVIVVTIPFGLGLAGWSQALLKRGVSSRLARGRYLSCWLTLAGVLMAVILFCPPGNELRVALIAVALGCTPIVYALTPAVLAEVVPASQRGAVFAINNSIASFAGVFSPVATGMLIQGMPGASGYELGFAVCGAIMISGGLVGIWLIDPERSARSVRSGIAFPGTLAADR